ncbi:MAG TPA: hypothetical protein VKN36_18875 [Eudoraea sp.]|nr:hypothetical protein [Eudoraea sp.]
MKTYYNPKKEVKRAPITGAKTRAVPTRSIKDGLVLKPKNYSLYSGLGLYHFDIYRCS